MPYAMSGFNNSEAFLGYGAGYNELLTAGYRDVSVNLRIDSPQVPSQVPPVGKTLCRQYCHAR
eukprot:888866-Rhodomonas_salina.9